MQCIVGYVNCICVSEIKTLYCFVICGALSRYPYKVGDYKSPKSKKNAWKAELGHTAF